MSTYQFGLDVISGNSSRPERVRISWWETTAIVVGALASLGTLIEISLRLNGKK